MCIKTTQAVLRYYVIEIKLAIENSQVEIINFYPIKDNAIMLGDTTKYISAGCDNKKVSVDDLEYGEI